MKKTTAPRPRPRPSDGRRPPRPLPALLFLWWAVTACTTAASIRATSDSGSTEEIIFERYDVVTGAAERQTILTGFFLGGPIADLAAVSLDENGERRLRIYRVGEGTAPAVEATLRPRVLFVDVAEIGGWERLISYEPGRLGWFDPESETDRVLVSVTTSYNPAPHGLHYAGVEPRGPFDEGEIPRIDITRDLNGDGRDDLIVPDVDGFWIAMQLSDGSFTDPVKLGPPEPFRDATALDEKRRYGTVGLSALTIPWYLSRVHAMDHDGDGLGDLVFWNGDHFEVHHQEMSGLFSPVPETFTTGVPFDSDGAYSLIFGLESRGLFSLLFGSRKKTERTVLHSLRDVDGDHVADLVTLTLSGRSLLKQRRRYQIHYGMPTPDGIRFAPEIGAAMVSQAGAPVGYASEWLEDIDGDGQVDILYGYVRTGIAGMVRALVGGSIAIGLEVYQIEDGSYPGVPTTTRKFRTDLGIRGGRDAGFFPAVLVGDVNGDGRSDVLLTKNRQELHLFPGVPGPELLARVPQKIAVRVPGDERNSWLVDLNRDGKEDVVMHHPSTSELHRVTLLLAP